MTKGNTSSAVLAVTALIGLLGGCVESDHQRMATAESRDHERRAQFEQCRAQGRTDCDTILNAPVNREASDDSVREHERRAAYERCMAAGGHDCDDLLKR